MSDLEAKIKITAQNETAAGFDGAADAAAAAAKQIEDAIANVKARIQAQMADVRKAFQEGLHFNPDSLKDGAGSGIPQNHGIGQAHVFGNAHADGEVQVRTGFGKQAA